MPRSLFRVRPLSLCCSLLLGPVQSLPRHQRMYPSDVLSVVRESDAVSGSVAAPLVEPITS